MHASDFDAITWGAEQALKPMIEYQVESLRFLLGGLSVVVQGMRLRLEEEMARIVELRAEPLRAAAGLRFRRGRDGNRL
jgi:hypothetical protein